MASNSGFILEFAGMQMAAHRSAIDRGFWDTPSEDGTILALVHSEVSEAVEALRRGNEASEKIPQYTELEEELADVVLRVMDFAQSKNLQVGAALVAKMLYNEKRTNKHGKVF